MHHETIRCLKPEVIREKKKGAERRGIGIGPGWNVGMKITTGRKGVGVKWGIEKKVTKAFLDIIVTWYDGL